MAASRGLTQPHAASRSRAARAVAAAAAARAVPPGSLEECGCAGDRSCQAESSSPAIDGTPTLGPTRPRVRRPLITTEWLGCPCAHCQVRHHLVTSYLLPPLYPTNVHAVSRRGASRGGCTRRLHVMRLRGGGGRCRFTPPSWSLAPRTCCGGHRWRTRRSANQRG